jgi:anaerobic C4-dicarboxylate transporter
MHSVGFSGHMGGLGLCGLGLGGLGLCGLDLSVGLDPSPPSVHIALCLLCFLVSSPSLRQSTSFVSNT